MFLPINTRQPLGLFPIATVLVIGVCILLQFTAPTKESIEKQLKVFCDSDFGNDFYRDLRTVPELRDQEFNENCPTMAVAIGIGKLDSILPNSQVSDERKETLVQDLARAKESLDFGSWRSLDPKDISLFSLFASAFTHVGWMHLIFNMLFLWIFGSVLENLVGRLKFFMIFIGADLFSNLIYLACAWTGVIEPVPTLGASSGIYGVMGAILCLYPRLEVDVLFWMISVIKVIQVPAYVFVWFYVISDIVTLMFKGMAGVNLIGHLSGFGIIYLVLRAQRPKVVPLL